MGSARLITHIIAVARPDYRLGIIFQPLLTCGVTGIAREDRVGGSGVNKTPTPCNCPWKKTRGGFRVPYSGSLLTSHTSV